MKILLIHEDWQTMFSASVLLFADGSSAIVPTEYVVAAAYLDGYDGNGYADYVTDNLDYGSREDWLTQLAEDYRRYILATIHPGEFVLQRSESKDYGWLCTYAPKGIVVQWEEAHLNDAQKVTILEDVREPDADEIAGIMSALGDWLMHHAKWLVIELPTTTSLIGNTCRWLRQQKMLSPIDLANLAHVRTNVLKDLESGKKIDGEKAQRIVDALDLMV